MADIYTMFIVDGAFADAGDPYTNYIRLDDLSMETAQMLLELATDRGYDVVIRLGGEDDAKETEE